MDNKRSRSGFTLVELLVVITIVAILGALGIVSYTQATQSARNAKRRADLESVKQALMLYRQEQTNNCFPPVSGTTHDSNAVTRYNNLAGYLVTGYLSALPTDPGTTSYSYARPGTNSGTNACPTRVTLRASSEPTGAAIVVNVP